MIFLIVIYINNLKTGLILFFSIVLFLYEIALFLFIVSAIIKKFKVIFKKYKKEFIDKLNNTANLSSVKKYKDFKGGSNE